MPAKNFFSGINKIRAAELLALVSLLFLLSRHYYHDSIGRYPEGIHTWAQADRLALARGFLRNGMDFFHPQTNSYVKLFGRSQPEKLDPVVSTDFPLHGYAVAVLMKLSGSEAPGIYRGYTLLLSLTGLVFLFLTARAVTHFFLFPWLLTAFVFFAPVFSYYQDGFLQSIPAMAFLWMGLWFLQRYERGGKSQDWTGALVLFSLAGLSRLPYSVFLAGLLLHEGVKVLRGRRITRAHWIGVPLAIAAVAFHYFYFYRHLYQEHGSIFLGEARAPENWAQFKEWMSIAWANWGGQYLSAAQYKVLLAAPLLALASLWLHRRAPVRIFAPLLWISLWALPFALAFTWIVARQFPGHDYYFLDLIFPTIVLLFFTALTAMKPVNDWQRWAAGALAVVGSLSFLAANHQVQRGRDAVTMEYRNDVRNQHYRHLRPLLEKHKLSDGPVALMPVHAPNIPLTEAGLMGFPILDAALSPDPWFDSLPCKAFVTEADYFFPVGMHRYPFLLRKMDFLECSGGLVLFRPRTGPDRPRPFDQVHEIFRLPSVSAWALAFDYDSLQPQGAFRMPAWDTLSTGAEHWGLCTAADEFPLEVTLPFQQQAMLIHVRARILSKEKGALTLQLVTQLDHSRESTNSFYHAAPWVMGADSPQGQWTQLDYWFYLPPAGKDAKESKFYFWNQERRTFLLDDFSLELFELGAAQYNRRIAPQP